MAAVALYRGAFAEVGFPGLKLAGVGRTDGEAGGRKPIVQKGSRSRPAGGGPGRKRGDEVFTFRPVTVPDWGGVPRIRIAPALPIHLWRREVHFTDGVKHLSIEQAAERTGLSLEELRAEWRATFPGMEDDIRAMMLECTPGPRDAA